MKSAVTSIPECIKLLRKMQSYCKKHPKAKADDVLYEFDDEISTIVDLLLNDIRKFLRSSLK